MRITIDNEDGRGAVDYSAAVAAEGPVRVNRALNAPSKCTAEIVLGIGGLPTPARRGRVVVTNGEGVTLFTGYLATEPVAIYAGEGLTGPVYRARLSAISDEWLLDRQGSGAGASADGLSLAQSGTAVVAQLTTTAQAGTTSALTVAPGGSARALGVFAVEPGATWSGNAAAAANATYSSYRALSGTVSVQSAGTITHAFSDADGTLAVAELSTANVRELANDVTLSGAEEPAAYVQELFTGDGTTTKFELSEPAFRGTNRTLLQDSFQGASFDTSQWVLSDAGNHLTLTSAGFTLNGGNGYDGQTMLTALNGIEMGGFVLAELGGVTFGAGSAGILAGFFEGATTLAGCFAGFRVRQSTSTTGGVTVLVPVLNGAEAGTVFTPVPEHSYTLRLRMFCPEMQRIFQRYYCMIDGEVQEFGPIAGVSAPMQVVFELVDEGASSNTPATVLYDTAAAAASPIAGSPATCSFVLADSVNLYGSVASVGVTRPGSLWVVSTLPSGAQQTRLIGLAGQGADYTASYGSESGSPGKITFFAGRVPVAGERITASYRLQRRSIARIADATSVASEAAAGAGVYVPGVSRWLGKVVAPVARSSADCESAAQAVLSMATARSAALAGTYSTINPGQDIWPGDVLAVTSAGVTHSLLIREVDVADYHAAPEVVSYKLSFANDWAAELADGLGLKLSATVASDATLPTAAASGPAEVLANLQSLTVTSVTSASLQVDAGCAPPVNGGFEVRRRDWSFGVGVDTPDLVLRSPVRSFSLPRSTEVEPFYVRMYDGSTPPVYSRFSSAVFVTWPVS